MPRGCPTGYNATACSSAKEHTQRYKETDGEEGHDWQGTQTLILTTTGRRSGEPRDTPLIYGTERR